MDPYLDAAPLWEIPNSSSFSQIFDTLLQKEFHNATIPFHSTVDRFNPQNVTPGSFPSLSPPSDDSSPSPPNLNNNNDTDGAGGEEGGDLKRKASAEEIENGPNQKTQHTAPAAEKKTAAAVQNRRKSTSGAAPKDEGKLLKRKEQNRAAQRAFRERKEKHVKDLEDKVAALEAKNERTQYENDNLRDLLSRLQAENLALKQSSFTFTVPKTASESGQASTSFAAQSPEFASSPRSPTSATSSVTATNSLDWSSLTTFDPTALNLLDDRPQPTATEGARQMDFGFGSSTDLAPNTSYTTIASNPMFMSYASAFDTATPVQDTNDNSFYDLGGFSWSPSPPVQNPDALSLDALFAGYMSRGIDYSFLNNNASLPSESPVTHHANVNHLMANLPSQSPDSSSKSSLNNSDPLFETTRNAPSDSDVDNNGHPNVGCPRTRSEMAKKIEEAGMSPFATKLQKSDSVFGTHISCAGTSLPKTQKSDQNIEVLSAWRSITSNPEFKNVDIDRLCDEFSKKAKCDGTKVVLEPQGVDSILKILSSSQQ